MPGLDGGTARTGRSQETSRAQRERAGFELLARQGFDCTTVDDVAVVLPEHREDLPQSTNLTSVLWPSGTVTRVSRPGRDREAASARSLTRVSRSGLSFGLDARSVGDERVGVPAGLLAGADALEHHFRRPGLLDHLQKLVPHRFGASGHLPGPGPGCPPRASIAFRAGPPRASVQMQRVTHEERRHDRSSERALTS